MKRLTKVQKSPPPPPPPNGLDGARERRRSAKK